jgi:hypothetical protein
MLHGDAAGATMGAPVPLRDDIPAEELRRLARQESDGRVACRLLGVANALDGMSREQAARRGSTRASRLSAGRAALRVVHSENGMLRLLHDRDLSWQKARPIHPEADRQAQVRSKKNSRR